MTVLFCVRPEHNAEKPDSTLLFRDLERYLNGMPKMDKKSLSFANFGYVALNAVTNTAPSKSKPPNSDAMVSCVNTETGVVESIEDSSLHDTPQDSGFLMQTIKIGNSECLVMFDRGSNVNLINGSLAEDEGLFVLTQTPTKLKLAGGGQMSTEYGKYLLTLGSEETGWHRMTCHGVPEVTVKFPRYDLSSINLEVCQTEELGLTDSALPPFVGGSSVDLLIGIQDVSLDPVLIWVLPCGLGIYRSPFTDIHGSNICFEVLTKHLQR